MDTADYSVKATSFALGSIHNDQLYAFLGLISEIGEVADKIKKQIRDNAGDFSDVFRYNLALELGDCFWYVNSICYTSNLKLDESAFDLQYKGDSEKDCRTLAYIILDTANLVKFSGFEISEDAKILINQTMVNNITNSLSQICLAIDYPVALVLQMNFDKLNCRKLKNTISGSGDHR